MSKLQNLSAEVGTVRRALLRAKEESGTHPLAPTPEESLVQILQESDWPNALTYAKRNEYAKNISRRGDRRRPRLSFLRPSLKSLEFGRFTRRTRRSICDPEYSFGFDTGSTSETTFSDILFSRLEIFEKKIFFFSNSIRIRLGYEIENAGESFSRRLRDGFESVFRILIHVVGPIGRQRKRLNSSYFGAIDTRKRVGGSPIKMGLKIPFFFSRSSANWQNESENSRRVFICDFYVFLGVTGPVNWFLQEWKTTTTLPAYWAFTVICWLKSTLVIFRKKLKIPHIRRSSLTFC